MTWMRNTLTGVVLVVGAAVASAQFQTARPSNGTPATVPTPLTSDRVVVSTGTSTVGTDGSIQWDSTSKILRLPTGGQSLDAAGNNTPQLHIGGDWDGTRGAAHVMMDGYGNVPAMTWRRSEGTQASKTAVGDGGQLLNFSIQGYDSSAFVLGARMRFVANGALSASNRGTDFLLQLQPSGSVDASTLLERMRVRGDSTLTLGTSPTAAPFKWDGTNQRLVLAHNGQTLDTTTDNPQIHIGGDFDGAGSQGHALIDAYGNVSSITFRRAQGTQASKTALANSNDMINLRAQGWDGSAYGSGGFFRYNANGAWSGSNRGTDAAIYLTANGSTAAPTETFRVATTGIQVGANLGTVSTTGVIRIPNSQYLSARGGTAVNVQMIGVTASNVVAVGDNIRNLQLAEVWETEPGNGDFRPITTNARDLGGATRIIKNTYTNKITHPLQSVTSTGSVDALAVTSSIVLLNNASDLTINGIAAGVDGQKVTFFSGGAGNVFFSHNSGSAAAGDKLSNIVTTAVTPLAAARGRATYVYRTAASTWVLLEHEQGAFITEAFTAGEFTANGSMTWTVAAGDVTTSGYYIRGRTMTWTFRYITTTVGGTPNTTLIKTAPLGVTIIQAFDGLLYGEDNSTKTVVWFFNNSNTGISFAKQAGGNWAAATDTTKIAGQLVFGIQ